MWKLNEAESCELCEEASSMKAVRSLNSLRKLAFSAQRLSQQLISSSLSQVDELPRGLLTHIHHGSSASFNLRIYS